MPLRILVVDDHEVARQGLANLLTTPQTIVASVASSGAEALELLQQGDRFDVILLDVRMPEEDGLATLEKIRALDHQIPVILLSSYDNPTYIARAAALGATDYILKTTPHVSVSKIIRSLAAGEPLHDDSELMRIKRKMLQDEDPSGIPQELALTTREAQVLRHVALGLSNKEIAFSLRISVETVKEHVQNLLRKMQANDRTDAAVRAVRMGVLD